MSEVGLDMSRWKTEAHFASWLGLCPDNRISGDKVLGKGHDVWSIAPLRRCAKPQPLIRSQTYLGAQYRRLRTKLGAPKLLPLWPTDSHDSSIECLKYGHSMSTKVPTTTRRNRQQQIDF